MDNLTTLTQDIKNFELQKEELFKSKKELDDKIKQLEYEKVKMEISKIQNQTRKKSKHASVAEVGTQTEYIMKKKKPPLLTNKITKNKKV